MTSFEANNSDFNLIDENNSFSITIPSHWQTKSVEKKTIKEINKLELRSQKAIEFHGKEVMERGNQIKIGDNEYRLSDFDTQKKTSYLEN